jgi:aminoglycoside N3'-acetyltransferase
MNIKNEIDNYIKQKVFKKKLKLKISPKTDLFINSVFDSLDFAEFSSFVNDKGFEFDLKRNKFKIPRTKSEILKILRPIVFKKENTKKIKKKEDSIEFFFKKIKNSFNIRKRQNIIIHSNFSRLLNFKITPKKFIDYFLKNFPDTTIYAPSGFFREKRTKLKNIKKIQPSNEFGLLSKELLKIGVKKKIFRNNNPFDNLIGFNLKEKYIKDKNTLAYGSNSPYRLLLNQNTSVMLIDVTFFYNSMFHMVELDTKVPYRKKINFKFNKKIFALFARKKNSLFLDYSRFEKEKEIKKIIKRISFKGIEIKFIDYNKLYKKSFNILTSKPNFLL